MDAADQAGGPVEQAFRHAPISRRRAFGSRAQTACFLRLRQLASFVSLVFFQPDPATMGGGNAQKSAMKVRSRAGAGASAAEPQLIRRRLVQRLRNQEKLAKAGAGEHSSLKEGVKLGN